MAKVIPFNGILYNREVIDKLEDVVAPPYDVISKEEQQALYDRHENNIVRLILGKKYNGDDEFDNPHTRAANYFNKWSTDGVFIRDSEECFYLESSEFKIGNNILSRLGLIGRVKIESFDKKIILPHEKTFSKVKSERLGLIKASKMNFSCIFGLYPDYKKLFFELDKIVKTEIPWADFLNYDGLRHRLWRINDRKFQSYLSNSLSHERIIIADGHHRYETALNYKNYISQKEISYKDPVNYVMMYLSSMEDPGLIIKPTHRMIKNLDSEKLDLLLNSARDYFDVINYGESRDKALNALKRSIRNAFVICSKNPIKYYFFELKQSPIDKIFSDQISKSLKELDITILTKIIFMKLLGLTQKNMDDTSFFGYISDVNLAINAVETGKYDAAFILNPTRIDQVKKIAEEGLIMPRKSTYFYPKVVSGLVQNSLVSVEN